ncbi:RsmB/NOP family class I SAM-dependent RNA methyltransferase [Fulvimarina sp. 2208YS6-2-32]|uniref:RsmB/NOP family class I SAM-dependent RNA methyltransferase n=1 Tax=Fulvimarina uroteuthidis TaxID=3098149 RepID=A0ABU5HY44_9HYPH|nr:RsmB/NOP family class I SAM-dependent RNA methyltransferase [Fulvimarina sp. 2208YS6-2-32]MDY8107975.1 RsmB/NOP family class I SAM-dependent RNA methyltransferase [Fulvimarina sp. 2208YS6-2-32]
MRLGGRLSAAIEILTDIETRHRPVAQALKDWGISHRFAGSKDRSAIGNLVYDALRRKRSYGHRMGSDAPNAIVAAAAMEGLSLDAEALTKAIDGDKFAPDLPDPETLRAFPEHRALDAPGAVRADIPDWLADRFEVLFGESWVEEAAALSDRPPLDLRANTLKASHDKVLEALSPFHAEPSGLTPTGIRIAPIEGDGRHPNVQVEAGFLKGWFEIQDEGSQLAALLSGAEPGMQILDYCAGAGGKTLALSAALENTGQIHAYDGDRQRLAPIYDRLARAGCRNVQVHDPRDELAELEAAMDIVFVDAPCSGTGTWRRRPDAKWRLSEANLEKRIAEQDAVLDQAARYVKPGGRLVYVTCSVLPDENAERIEAFLGGAGGFVPLDLGGIWERAMATGASPEAGAEGNAEVHRLALSAGTALMMTPLKTGTDGFFVCVMERPA